ncbi:hypothetical protein CCAX7_000240 [Capsulimonas corticalis]|uniref:Uncharacterized protein n=1 Tax=Capsulimonas corticalis TaxID=2219043 RepID=A0A402CRC8_9BACT|nr:hypothetical protein [Capsulimonas corticalis]BDI27973.1 hypothetical protein CCAX7_000240 [Capsulimonas corticalis]
MKTKNQPSPVPSLHFVMIVASVSLIVLSMFFYMFAPSGKEQTFAGVITLMLGFLTGKLSNQFGRPLRAAASVDAVPDDDDDEEDSDSGD